MKGPTSRASIFAKLRGDSVAMTHNQERYIMLLVCFSIAYTPVVSAVIGVTRQFVILPFKLDSILVYVPLIYVALRTIPVIVKLFPWEELVPFLLLYIAILFSYLQHATTSMLQAYYFNLFSTALASTLPYYLLFRVCRPNSRLLDYLGYAAVAIVAAQCINIFMLHGLGDSIYSQFKSYQTLPACAICAVQLFQGSSIGRRIGAGICFGAGLILLATTGARGPLLVALLVFVFMFCTMSSFAGWKRALIAIVVTSIGVMALLFYEDIMELAFAVLSNFGVGTRLEIKFFNNSLFVDNARNDIAETCMQLIVNNPVLGVGVGYEREVVAYSMGNSDIYGYFPHNIIIELATQFGLVFGLALSLALILFVVNAYRKATRSEKNILAILVAIGFCPLLFSGTYLDWPMLYALLGCCAMILRPLPGTKQE